MQILFQRWSYSYYLNANVLAINNPMYHIASDLYCGWYLGTKDEDYIEYIVRLVKKMCTLHNIPTSNVTFMGSSSAGTAAIHCSCYLQNSMSFSINPQILPNVGTGMLNDYAKMGVSLDELNERRTNTIELLRKTNSKNIICVNIRSDKDLFPLFDVSDQLNIKLEYGLNINQNNTVYIWLFEAFGNRLAHGTFEDRPMLYAIDYLINLIQNNKEIDCNLVRIFSEFWFERYKNETNHISEMMDVLYSPEAPEIYRNKFPYNLDGSEWENPDISYKLSQIYEMGNEYVQKDMSLAIQHMEEAYHMDSRYANEYGNLLYREGSESNLEQAFKIAKQHADLGNIGCKLLVARAYLSGKGVSKNRDEAIQYLEQIYTNSTWAKKLLLDALWDYCPESEAKFLKYAIQFSNEDLKESFYYLGCAYQKGYGVETDIIEAKKWFKKAADSGMESAKKILSTMNDAS